MSKTAFVFPGQGSQSVGMLSDLAGDHSVVGETFSEASERLGYDLWDLVSNGPEDRLGQTEYTQPALVAASIAVWRIALDEGAPRPDVVAGHSLGEYSALVAAEALEFADAIGLVQRRGQFMQSAVPVGKGGMAAILGLDDETVTKICQDVSEGEDIVQAANFNAPGQVVIAGTMAALERAIESCKSSGAKRAMPLAVSAPFHSALMQPAAERMADALGEVAISAPSIPVIQNVGADYERDPERIRANLVEQMYSAVLWTSTIQRMAADGVTGVVECGPGKVLSGLVKRIDKSIETRGLGDSSSMASAASELWS